MSSIAWPADGHVFALWRSGFASADYVPLSLSWLLCGQRSLADGGHLFAPAAQVSLCGPLLCPCAATPESGKSDGLKPLELAEVSADCAKVPVRQHPTLEEVVDRLTAPELS